MTLTRRLFVRNAAMTATAARFLPVAFAQDRLIAHEETFNEENLTTLSGLSRKSFEAWIGSSFRASLNGKPMGTLLLLTVKDRSPRAEDGSESAAPARPTSQTLQPRSETTLSSGFSLRFKGSGRALTQNTYLLSHDWLGTFPLFLVPSGLSNRWPTCTAVFNLLDSPASKRPG
jgi:hypothetical protein